MKRREFLLRSAALTAALTSPFAVGNETKKGPQLGLTTYMIGSKWTFPQLIEYLPNFEIFGLEFRTDLKFGHGVELDSPKSRRAEVKKLFADSPVKLVGVACGERYDSPDAAKLEKSIERTKELLQFCADLGSPGLRVFPNDFQKEVPQEKTLEQIAESLRKLAPTAESLGVELRLEAHGNAGLLPHLATIAKAVNNPKVRIMLNSDFRDTKGEGLSANLEMVKPYLAGIAHIHDLTAKNYTEAKFYETQFAFLKNAGWNGFCMLEIGDKPDDETRLAEIVRQKKRWDEIMATI